MTTRGFTAAAFAVASVLSACQTVGNGKALDGDAVAAVNRSTKTDTQTTATTDGAPLTIGKSTKVDVDSAWGQASVTQFSSGYEVWVYQKIAGLPKFVSYIPLFGLAAPNLEERTAETALLFDPKGILRKVERRDRTLSQENKD